MYRYPPAFFSSPTMSPIFSRSASAPHSSIDYARGARVPPPSSWRPSASPCLSYSLFYSHITFFGRAREQFKGAQIDDAAGDTVHLFFATRSPPAALHSIQATASTSRTGIPQGELEKGISESVNPVRHRVYWQRSVPYVATTMKTAMTKKMATAKTSHATILFTAWKAPCTSSPTISVVSGKVCRESKTSKLPPLSCLAAHISELEYLVNRRSWCPNSFRF